MSVQDRDLDAVLRRLVEGARAALGDTFCGAYLQGSLALGDFDEDSDVDFLVVTHGEVTDAQLPDLQALHRRIYELESPWAQHLDGSYVSKERLRRIETPPSPLLYLDNGATELVRDEHCNTAVVRWTLREHGVVLAGPDPKSLVDPVSADELRAEARAALRKWAEWAREPHQRFGPGALSRRQQGLLVLSLCRMLHTLECGRVTSKPEAGRWALTALDPEWSPLIRRALDDRPGQWRQVHEQADAEAVERALAFADYAITEATRAGPRPSRGSRVRPSARR
jgi:predicted nucleotidyltransferase